MFASARRGRAVGTAVLALVGVSMVVGPARSQAPVVDAGIVVAEVDGGAAAGASDDDDDQGPDDPATALPRPPDDPAARRTWLSAELDRAVAASPRLASATIGAAVVDVATGEALWNHDGARALSLASAQKVLTTAAALGALGPGFRWRTSIYGERFDAATGLVDGDLIVRGRGDPTLTQADVANLVRDLTWRGVERVAGDLVIDTSYFDAVDEPPRYADQPKERAGFRAPIGAASVERNAVTAVVTADRRGLGLANVTLDPPGGDYVRVVEAAVVTTAVGRTRIAVATDVKRDHLELRITGQIAATDGVAFVRRRVDDPTALFAAVLRAELADAGIRIRGRGAIRRALAATDRVEILAEHESAPLAEVVRTMAKTSDNYMAETVLKTMGAERRAATDGGPGTWADGLAVVTEMMTAAGVAPGSVRVENGSGLFDASSVSAEALAKVLVAGWRDFRVGPELASAMAVGGVDGTLRRRFTGPELRGRVRAKTGTLAAVTALAGYVGTDGLRPMAFVVLVNALPPGTRADAKAMQDAIATLALAYSAR